MTQQSMVNDIQQVMTESINYLTDRMTLNAVSKTGKVTIEEAALYNKMATKVITEMSEEIVPNISNTPYNNYRQTSGNKQLDESTQIVSALLKNHK